MNTMMKKIMYVDAETDGLYGPFLTVAMLVTDQDGNEIEKNYWGIRKENLVINEPWVRENVEPLMGDYEPCENEADMLERAWAFWREHCDATVVADVPFPVESRLFQTCVQANPAERMFQAPYPLMDLASILFAKGIDPDTARVDLLPEEMRTSAAQHNAEFDVLMTSAILQKVMG